MPTDVELVNVALRKCGARRVMALTDSVPSAGIAADILANERDELLRSSTWNFATTRTQLAASSTIPVFEWAFAYPLPSDFMRIISVHDNSRGGGDLKYRMESVLQADGSSVICVLTNASAPIYLRYVKTVTDVNTMSPSFRDALVLRMAKIFAVSVAKSNALYAALDEELKAVLRTARSVDGMEDYPDRLPEGSWADSRNAYGWGRRR